MPGSVAGGCSVRVVLRTVPQPAQATVVTVMVPTSPQSGQTRLPPQPWSLGSRAGTSLREHGDPPDQVVGCGGVAGGGEADLPSFADLAGVRVALGDGAGLEDAGAGDGREVLAGGIGRAAAGVGQSRPVGTVDQPSASVAPRRWAASASKRLDETKHLLAGSHRPGAQHGHGGALQEPEVGELRLGFLGARCGWPRVVAAGRPFRRVRRRVRHGRKHSRRPYPHLAVSWEWRRFSTRCGPMTMMAGSGRFHPSQGTHGAIERLRDVRVRNSPSSHVLTASGRAHWRGTGESIWVGSGAG